MKEKHVFTRYMSEIVIVFILPCLDKGSVIIRQK